MSGINKNLDFALGYDDDHKSTEDSRNLHFALWALPARPGQIVCMAGSKVIVRAACNAGERHLADMVRDALQNIRYPNGGGPRPYNFPQL